MLFLSAWGNTLDGNWQKYQLVVQYFYNMPGALLGSSDGSHKSDIMLEVSQSVLEIVAYF